MKNTNTGTDVSEVAGQVYEAWFAALELLPLAATSLYKELLDAWFPLFSQTDFFYFVCRHTCRFSWIDIEWKTEYKIL